MPPMQYGPSGGAVRVVIASDAPQAVAELDKLAGYADQVSLVGFIRHPQELDEDLEALLPDLVLLYTGFGGLDTVVLAATWPRARPSSGSWSSSTPPTRSSSPAWRTRVPPTVGADADPATPWSPPSAARWHQPPPRRRALPPAWPGMTPPVLWPGSGRPSRRARSARPSRSAAPEPWAAAETPVEAAPPAPATRLAGSEEQAPEETAERRPRFPSSSSTPRPSRPPPRRRPRRPGRGSPPSPRGPGGGRAARARRSRIPSRSQPVRPRLPRRRTGGNAELVVVFSGKGGVGKSLIATNLAVALAAEGERVALVDLDLQFGDVAVMLHVESHPTAIDALAQQGDQIDSDFIEEVMATGPEGVRALLAPASPEFADLVNTANLRAILRELAKGYDHIVVDTPSHLEERNLEAIEMADQIVVVTSFNFPAIKDTKVTLKLLQSLGVERTRSASSSTRPGPRSASSAARSRRASASGCCGASLRAQGGRLHRQRAGRSSPRSRRRSSASSSGCWWTRSPGRGGRPGGQGGRRDREPADQPAGASRSGAAEDGSSRDPRAGRRRVGARCMENVTRRLGQEGDLVVCAVAQDGDTRSRRRCAPGRTWPWWTRGCPAWTASRPPRCWSSTCPGRG